MENTINYLAILLVIESRASKGPLFTIIMKSRTKTTLLQLAMIKVVGRENYTKI